MKHKWKEMQFTNHGGTAWVRLDEAEKALKEQGDKAYEMWYTTVQERAEKAEEGYNRVVCENQRLIQDWRQAENELRKLKLILMCEGRHCYNCQLFANHKCDWKPNIVDHNIGWDTLKGFYCSEWEGRK